MEFEISFASNSPMQIEFKPNIEEKLSIEKGWPNPQIVYVKSL